ncbi:MAG: HNH endonuclease [Actinobacteria bacterium]|nr:HNH endonuclease [Actinomycetota bacterium]
MQPNDLQRIDRCVAAMQFAHAELLSIVPSFNKSKAWKRDGATSMSAWLARRYGVSRYTARMWVVVANRLVELPHLGRAYSTGGLSWDQLVLVSELASPESDSWWASDGPHWSLPRLHRAVERLRKAKERAERDAYATRSVVIHQESETRRFYLDAILPPEEGAAVKAALEARAEDIVLADEPVDAGEARMADALVELVTGSAGDSRTVMVVHVDEASLQGSHKTSRGVALAETESGTRIGPQAVRRIACEAKVEWVRERDGRPVGVGRTTRHIPPRLLRLLRFRDGGMCVFPGCERRSWLKAHHLRHWADGGPTDLDNLVLLCHAHHRLLHEGRWRAVGRPPELRFHDPGGRALARAPVRPEALSA